MQKRIIGTDEAGYGPQLGPLVIGLSAWDVDPASDSGALFDTFPCDCEFDGLGRVRVNDSKQLYAPNKSGGLSGLEATVLAATAATQQERPMDLAAWLRCMSVNVDALLAPVRWFRQLDHSFPEGPGSAVDWEELKNQSDHQWRSIDRGLTRCAVQVIPAAAFNKFCDEAGNKATLLSEQTVQLALRDMEWCGARQVEVFSDKHGGRAYYGGLLQHFFPDAVLQIETEGREESCYRLIEPEREIRWHFRAKGDRFVPVALASILAKYARERLMSVFNAYWAARVDDLVPTAGYPGDAKRFLGSIEAVVRREGISQEELVRSK